MPINPCRNPKCDFFNKSLPSNAKVCPMCGEPLGNVLPPPAESPSAMPTPQPRVVPTPRPTPSPAPYYQEYQTPPQQPPFPAPSPQPPPFAAQPPLRPVFRLIHSTGREFYLKGNEGYIGRRGQNSTTVPEVDLTGIPNEGIVSRAHARFYWDAAQNTYMIADNSSRNGTFLNGMLLQPGIPYRLGQGVSLQLGQEGLVCFTVAIG